MATVGPLPGDCFLCPRAVGSLLVSVAAGLATSLASVPLRLRASGLFTSVFEDQYGLVPQGSVLFEHSHVL